jgi:hypothetical protein
MAVWEINSVFDWTAGKWVITMTSSYYQEDDMQVVYFQHVEERSEVTLEVQF